MKNNRKITSLDKILDKKYGKKGQPKRELWEQQLSDIRLSTLMKIIQQGLGGQLILTLKL